MPLRHNSHDRGHAGRESRGHQIRGGKTFPFPLIIDGGVGLQLASRRTMHRGAVELPFVSDVDFDQGIPAQPCPPPGERAQEAAPPKRNMIPDPAAAPSNTLSNSKVIERR